MGNHGITTLYRLFGVVDDNLLYILGELDTLSLSDDLINEIKATCQGFQKVLFNAKDKIHTLETGLSELSRSSSHGTPAGDQDLPTTIDSIDNTIADQLHLMHKLVTNCQELSGNDGNITLASVLLNESAANILNVYANIKDEFKLLSENTKEVKDQNKSTTGVNQESKALTKRAIRVSENEYQLPCSACGKIAAVFKTSILKHDKDSVKQKEINYSGITHGPQDLGIDDAEKIFDWLEKDEIHEIHSLLLDYQSRDQGIDAYCPDCGKIYCQLHYNPVEEWEGSRYDCTYGTCPEGHKRMIHD